MTRLTKAQRALIEKHDRAHDSTARAIATLQRLKVKPKPSLLRLHSNIVSCSYDRTLTRTISGVCSTPTICSDDYSYLSRGAILRTPIPLLYEHDSSGQFKQGGAIGQVVFLCKTSKQITCSAVIYDNGPGTLAWELIRAGELTGLSVGVDDLHLLAKVDGVRFYNRFTIKEISVCRNPANPDCLLRFEEER